MASCVAYVRAMWNGSRNGDHSAVVVRIECKEDQHVARAARHLRAHPLHDDANSFAGGGLPPEGSPRGCASVLRASELSTSLLSSVMKT